MLDFIPQKQHCGSFKFLFNLRKSAAENYRFLVETYDDNALPESTCRQWFRRFKNHDFNVKDKESEGSPKIFEDKDLEAIFVEDLSKTEIRLVTA